MVKSQPGTSAGDQIERMRDALTHRGPDAAGRWEDDHIALGHRRLAVIDLSEQGQQPMHSFDERYVLVFNGEIYNFRELRQDLGPHPWRGDSDTEVLLQGICRWGLLETVQRCVGMFALALYDRKQQTLTLVRDRLGIKPLYYGWVGKQFVFSSELRGIEAGFSDSLEVDRDSLSGYLRHYYVPANDSIYANIKKLPPASLLTIACHREASGGKPLDQPGIERYWQLQDAPALAPDATPQELLDGFVQQARQAVRSRMVADVPLGAFLSGGLDSSLVCALMAEASDKPINTFTMGFEDPAFDESPHGAAVAAHLGCQHNNAMVTPQDLLDVVDSLPELLDEPFSDSSLIPTYLVCAKAKTQVSVALSGDGGDELFWGYARYPLWERLSKLLAPLPQSLRPVVAALVSNPMTRGIANLIPPPRWLGRKHPLPGRLTNIAEMIRSTDAMDLYRRMISLQKHPDDLVIGGHERQTVYSDPNHWTAQLEEWKRVSTLDLHAYLPDDILAKVDRASMAVSLEARVPLLDHRLVEYCYALPQAQIRQPGSSKWLLRQALARYVPTELIERPKQGFGVPIDDWLRGPLQSWMTDLLSEARLRADGYLEPAPVQRLLREHLSGHADWGPRLWNLLMFQVWRQQRGG